MTGIIPTSLFLLIVSLTGCFAIDPATISAAASAVIAGSSLTGTTLSQLNNNGYRVSCGIEVENWTRFPLTFPTVRIGGGALQNPPVPILPSNREAMVARKTSDTATGSYGTVSWLVEGLQRRIVVMWSAPYDFNFHSNWLGVGITQNGYTDHYTPWFEQMYYRRGATNLGFNRREYVWRFTPLVYRDDKIIISGIMGSSHKAEVKIVVRPVNDNDLAHNIRQLLQH